MHSLRPLTPDDAEQYTALRAEMITLEPWAFLGVPGDDYATDPQVMRQRLADPEQVIFGAFDEATGDLAAVAGLYRDKRAKRRHRAGIWGVYTRPESRGHGLSRRLMLMAIEHARAWPGVAIIALSAADRSKAAIALYASLGFQQWGLEPDSTRVNGEPIPEVHMTLTL